MIHKHDQTPANPPIVDMRKIGQSLGLPWSHARKLIEGAGIRVIEEAGAPRSWFVSGSAWRRFCEEHQLEVLS